MPNFASALDVRASDVERPPVAPLGHYVWKITKPAQFGKVESDKGKWDTVSFPCRAVEAKDDVDTDGLTAIGGIKALNSKVQFMFEAGDDAESVAKFDATMYNMTQFLSVHCALGDGTVRELIGKCVGASFIGAGKHRPDKNNEDLKYFEIGKTAPIEA